MSINILNSAQNSPFDRTGNNKTLPKTSYFPRDSTRGTVSRMSILSFYNSQIKYLIKDVFFYIKISSPYLDITANFLNRIVRRTLNNDIGEKCLDSHSSCIIFHCHLFNVKWFQCWYFQFG